MSLNWVKCWLDLESTSRRDLSNSLHLLRLFDLRPFSNSKISLWVFKNHITIVPISKLHAVVVNRDWNRWSNESSKSILDDLQVDLPNVSLACKLVYCKEDICCCRNSGRLSSILQVNCLVSKLPASTRRSVALDSTDNWNFELRRESSELFCNCFSFLVQSRVCLWRVCTHDVQIVNNNQIWSECKMLFQLLAVLLYHCSAASPSWELLYSEKSIWHSKLQSFDSLPQALSCKAELVYVQLADDAVKSSWVHVLAHLICDQKNFLVLENVWEDEICHEHWLSKPWLCHVQHQAGLLDWKTTICDIVKSTQAHWHFSVNLL